MAAAQLKVRHVGTYANQRHLVATLEDGSTVEFMGTPYGSPGPVMVTWCGQWISVTDPARFGDEFGPKWVRRYFDA